MSDEARNPFGGFLFSGPDDALTHLSDAAKVEGLNLVPVDLGDGVIRLCLPREHSFGNVGMALVNRSQAGEFGAISMALFGGTAHPPH